MVGPKKQDFWPRINILKGNSFFKSVDELWFIKKCQKRTFKVNFLCILKIQWFPLSILIFGQKSCFLGPTIFKIPQPNWYYTDSNQKKGVAIQKKNWHSNICQNLSIGKDIWLLFIKETKSLAQSWVLSLSKLNLRGLDHLDPGSM